MSRPPGDPDDDLAAPAGTAPWEAVSAARGATPPPVPADESGVVSIPIDLPMVLADDEASAAAADDELFAREALAAAEAGNGHAEILMCARALRAEARSEVAAALPLWRAAFERDPTLLVAYWGFSRALGRSGAWEALVAVVDQRIEALRARGEAAASMRADLWFERARLEEDRLQRDEEALRSLRTGLVEAPDHPGLLLSLLLLGFRRSEAGATIQALGGLLRRPLPPALRARASAWLAGLERRTDSEGTPPGADRRRADNPAAARALSTLQTALGTVGDEHAAPLLDELSRLARGTAAPATRAAILGEIIAHSGAADPVGQRTGGGHAERLVALLRERARLLHDELGQPEAAIAALRDAVDRLPAHPLALTELADLLEARAHGHDASADTTPDDGGANARDLQDLLASVSTGPDASPDEAHGELALRVAARLIRRGRAVEALALLEKHPERAGGRPDVFALESMARAAVGDVGGLAHAFQGLAERLMEGVSASPGDAGASAVVAASDALVIAGTLRETMTPRSGGNVDDAPNGDEDLALRLYRRAAEITPDNQVAWEAVERRLWTTEKWSALAETLLSRLAHVDARKGAAAGAEALDVERERLLEELVAVHRDLLDESESALTFQERLLGARPGKANLEDDIPAAARIRAWVRWLDLAWRADRSATVPGANTASARTVETLRALAEQAASAELAAALRVAGARTAAAAGDGESARGLFAAAVADDATGAAVAGLERLAGERAGHTGERDQATSSAAARAALVREELGRAEEDAERTSGDEDTAGARARVRALRFRLAWHALGAGQPDAALAALAPLRTEADQVARAWSWEIARGSGDPRLALAVLPSATDTHAHAHKASGEGSQFGGAGLWARVDLAEAREQAGDLKGAEAAFREAHAQEPSTDAALGLLRVATARGDAAMVLEGTRALTPLVDAHTARLLSREAALLSLLQPAGTGGAAPSAEADAGPHPGAADGGADAAIDIVLGWARATRAGDGMGAAAGLLGLGRALPREGAGGVDLALDRMGLLARAAARARMGGAALAGAVHDQVQALSSGAAPIGVGLADLPIAGHAERAAARAARAERNGGALAYALELERGLDAEARGDGRGAVEAFARALGRDEDGIEALDGIKRVARACGDLPGAARAGMRLGMVLRVPARAAAELGMAAQLWEDLGRQEEAIVAYWQALARDPRSVWLFERLRGLLLRRRDWTGLDNLYGHRLAAVGDRHTGTALLLERAEHRLRRLDDRKAAIDDLKRILKIDPDHPAALRLLATLATQMEYFRQAVRFLDRLLAQTRDEDQAATLRLELADVHESAREPARAVEVLREAVSARARDPVPWQRLIDLLLRLGDWQAALATLRSWDAVVAAPVPKAAIWMRIGGLLRDHARDPAGAAAAFTTAAELDPLGDGVRALLALHEHAGTAAAREETIAGAIAAMRAALGSDPLDVARLRRLRELYGWSAGTGVGGSDGAVVVGQVLALAGEDVAAPATRRGDAHTPLPAAFWTRLRVPGGSELAAAVWPLLAAAVDELWPLPKARVPARERVTPGAEPRLAWVEAAAAALGLAGLEIALARPGSPGGDPGDVSVLPLEGSHPILVVGRGLLAGDAAARFRIGRALGLLRDRATVLERLDAATLAEAFAAAAVVAGAPAVSPRPAALEERARALAKAMSRKERKALEQEASRFASGSVDAAAFRDALLGAADRLGLLFAGDVAVAVRLTADLKPDDKTGAATAAIGREARARSLLRFALSEDHLMARRELGQGRIDGG